MNVVEIPPPCSAEVLEEAVSRYAGAVKSRAIAVHRIAAHPAGFVVARLLVVTDHIGVDNRFFFSALHRVPSRLHRAFRHEPYVLPAWSLRVMQYTPHRPVELVAGRDVIEPFIRQTGHDEHWCRTLEAYCEFAAFHAHAVHTNVLNGAQVFANAGALLGALGQASTVLPEAADRWYAAQLEVLHRGFLVQERREETVREAWRLFERGFGRFDTLLRERLRATTSVQAVARARSRLTGMQECADFDREYAFRRSRDITGYYQELASMGFPFGHLFSTAAHTGAPRAQPASPLLDALVQNVYRVRRRLTDYARA